CNEQLKAFITLPEPVAMFIRADPLPLLDPSHACVVSDLLQLFFLAEIVANVMEINLAVLFSGRILDQQRDGNGRTTAYAEYVVFLLASLLARSACVTAQMKYVYDGKLISQAFAQTIRCIGLDKARVCHKTDDPRVTYTVTGPADGSDVAVIQGVFVCCIRAGGIGIPDARIQRRIGYVGVVGIGIALTDRVRRVPNDYSNI